MQYPVDAQADAELFFVRFEMDIRSTLDNGVVEDQVDQLDGRGVLVDIPLGIPIVILGLHDLDRGVLAQFDLVQELLGLDSG